VAELNGGGGVVNRFIRGLELVRSVHHGWYVYNGRGDVVQRVGSGGLLLHAYRYDGFGREWDKDGENTNPFRFNSEYYDFETGMQYLRARYFDSDVGRFTQEDPHWHIGNHVFGNEAIRMNERQDRFGREFYTKVPNMWAMMQAGNLYVYCVNNPIMWADPSGESILLKSIAVAAVAALKAAVTKGTAKASGFVTTKVVTMVTTSTGAVIAVKKTVAKNVDFIMEKAKQIANWGGSVFKKLDANNFRENLRILTERSKTSIKGFEAHHIFPQHFRADFAKMGINVDNPLFGSFVQKQIHRSFNHSYNAIWEAFWTPFRNTGTLPTQQQVLQKAMDLSRKFGFDLNF